MLVILEMLTNIQGQVCMFLFFLFNAETQ